MNSNLENRKKKGTIYGYLGLIIIILGMGLYILYDKNLILSFAKKEFDSSLKECDSCICDNENKQNQKIEVDLSKSLNPYDGYFKYEIDDYIHNSYGLSMKINDDKKSVSLKIDFNKVKKELGSSEETSSFIEQYEITGFNQKIEKIYFGEMAHTSLGDVLLYLMEDKTIMYTRLFDNKTSCKYHPFICTSDDIKQLDFTPHLIEKVSNVVDIYNTRVFFTTGGSRSPIAVTSDGSFYDLSKFIDL